MTEKEIQEAPHWFSFPAFPVEDWQYEVASHNTRQSYKDWVLARMASE